MQVGITPTTELAINTPPSSTSCTVLATVASVDVQVDAPTSVHFPRDDAALLPENDAAPTTVVTSAPRAVFPLPPAPTKAAAKKRKPVGDRPASAQVQAPLALVDTTNVPAGKRAKVRARPVP